LQNCVPELTNNKNTHATAQNKRSVGGKQESINSQISHLHVCSAELLKYGVMTSSLWAFSKRHQVDKIDKSSGVDIHFAKPITRIKNLIECFYFNMRQLFFDTEWATLHCSSCSKCWGKVMNRSKMAITRKWQPQSITVQKCEFWWLNQLFSGFYSQIGQIQLWSYVGFLIFSVWEKCCLST